MKNLLIELLCNRFAFTTPLARFMKTAVFPCCKTNWGCAFTGAKLTGGVLISQAYYYELLQGKTGRHDLKIKELKEK